MKRKVTAQWLEKYNRWQCKAQREGHRRTFTSYTPGKRGKAEAERKANLWLNGLINGNERFDALFALFLEDQKARTSTGNYTNAESIGRIWLTPRIGKKRMENLTQQDFQDILNQAAEKGRSRKTISNIRGVITAFLRFARKKSATDMRADDLVIPGKAVAGTRSIHGHKELMTLFTTATTTFRGETVDEWYIHAFRFLAVSGLRPGELCDLRADQPEGKLCVGGSFNRFKEHTSGKTRNAIRTFILPSLAVRIIEDQRAMLKAKRVISPYLFPREDGEQTTSAFLYKRWQRYQQRNGLPGISLYELRHTFISMCKGVIPEPLIQPVVGHSSTMPSYHTYGHGLPGEQETVAGMIDNVFVDMAEALKKAKS